MERWAHLEINNVLDFNNLQQPSTAILCWHKSEFEISTGFSYRWTFVLKRIWWYFRMRCETKWCPRPTHRDYHSLLDWLCQPTPDNWLKWSPELYNQNRKQYSFIWKAHDRKIHIKGWSCQILPSILSLRRFAHFPLDGDCGNFRALLQQGPITLLPILSVNWILQ